MRKYLFISLTIMTCGCFSGEDFYDYYRDEDLWRLPLLKPYQLTNIAGITKERRFGDNWHLTFRTLRDSVSQANVNVSMINVDRGIIYGYGTANPCDHFIINTATGQENTYKDVDEWKKQLTRLNADYNKVYDVLDLFEKFRSQKQLMWRPVNP